MDVHVFAYGPKTGPAFLRFLAFGIIRDGGVGQKGGVGLLTSLVFVPHDLPSDRLCTSLHIRQGTLDPSSLLPCTYFMLRWIRLLYFVAHTSCYVGYVVCTSSHIRQGTLDMARSSLLPCTYIMLRWVRLLYFLAHTLCYVFCNSLSEEST